MIHNNTLQKYLQMIRIFVKSITLLLFCQPIILTYDRNEVILSKAQIDSFLFFANLIIGTLL